MKKYAEALVTRLRDQNAWPGVVSSATFNELQAKITETIKKGTLEGNLAAMLLMHQLAEELIRMLAEDAHFYMQLRLYPLPYHREMPKRLMFGQVLKELESTVWFQNKKYICEHAKVLNDIRVPIVHGLTKPGAIRAVERDVKKAWEIYRSFSWLALEAHMVFHSQFGELEQSENWPPKDVVFMRDDGSLFE